MGDFVDRQSDFPNRRKIQIISQTPNEIIADIFREEGDVSVEGTPITAALLNTWQDNINNSAKNSSDANTAAQLALEKVNNTENNSSEALEKAAEAKSIAEEMKDRVIQGDGTIVAVDGENRLTWDANVKLDKNQGVENAKKNITIGDDGYIAPTDYIYIGNIKVYQEAEGLAFEFPEEN